MDLQEDSQSCGKACVRAAVAFLRPRAGFGFLPIREDCQSFLTLKRELADHGILAEGRSSSNPLSHLKKGRVLILQARFGGRYHFVVGFKSQRGRVDLFDPQAGRFWLKTEEANSLFTGNVLVLRKEETPRVPCSHRLPCPFSAWALMGLVLLALAKGVSAFFFLVRVGDKTQGGLALAWLLAFGLALGLSAALTLRVNAKANGEVAIPWLAKRKDPKGFCDALSLVSLWAGPVVGAMDRAVAIGLAVWILAMTDLALVWLLLSGLFLFLALSLFQRDVLDRKKAESGYREAMLLVSLEKGRDAAREDYRRASGIAHRYAGMKTIAFGAALGLLLLGLLGYGMAKGIQSASRFLSTALLMGSACLSFSRLLALKADLSGYRAALYRLGPEYWAVLEKKER